MDCYSSFLSIKIYHYLYLLPVPFLPIVLYFQGMGLLRIAGIDAPKRNGFRIYSIYAKWGICMALYNLMIGMVPVIEWLCATETMVF
jgi:hypothetical protein